VNFITVIGLIAAALTTSAYLPQVLKSWRTKSAKDLSLGMLAILCTGIFLWLIYGILNQDLPIILSNAVTLMLTLAILVLKIKHG